MADIEIRTKRLVLRRIARDDAAALHAVFSDPEAMRYWSTLPHGSLAVTEAWIGQTIECTVAGEADDYAVVLDGAVIGKAGFWQGNEIGVILSRAHWGKGYATEALCPVIRRALALGLDRITVDIDPGNTASLRLFESLGFRPVGSAKATVLVGEVWADSLYLALTPDWWATNAT